MGSGSKPKAIQPTKAELALQRAQVVALANQDNELRARQKRIFRGMSGGRSSILKAGMASASRAAAPAGPTTGVGAGAIRNPSGRR